MSNSAPPPNSWPSDDDDDDDDNSKTTPPLDSNSPPPSSNSESSPPPPPPLDSKSSPPSSNSESSPPLDSKSPPPSSNSESSPPPLDSKSPPPSSDSQAPPPPTESKSPPPSPDSEASPPPQGLSSNSSSKTPPTSNETNSPPPPAKSTVPSPSESKSPPPNSPPLSKSNSPPPHPSNTSDVVSPLSPPSQTLSSSNHSRYPPPTRSPLSQSAVPINPSPPSTSGKHEKISSRHTDSSPAGSSETRNDALSIGTGLLAIIGILVVLAAIFSVISKKRRRREALTYQIGPSSFSVKADGYYHRQTNQPGGTGYSGPYYGPGASLIYSSGANTSHRGQQYLSGAQEPPGSKSCFTYEELISITNNFSQENLIGEGGFGCVYKGWLPDGRCVAVKQLKSGSGQGEREFRAEVEIISRVHHRHLVSLVGYCIAEYHRMLIYEFVPNGTLEEHLHGKGVPVTDWSQRMKIAIGSARGLAYLHEDCHPRIIHRDIKSANILLDSEFEAQVADFGLARLSNDTHTPVSTRVMGTFGYLAPEYASSGKLSDRSDVYSFGVVLLELITGRMPVDTSQPIGDESLVEWARPLLIRAIETEDCAKLVDVRLQNNYVKSEMLRMIEVAAACVRHSAPKRPRMAQVLRALDNEGYMADLSNGVKVGQSRQFDCNQYSTDIEKFRRMAFAIDECSSEFEHTGEQGNWSSAYGAPQRPPVPWKNGEHSSEDSGHESETRAMNLRTYDKDSSSRY